MLISMIKTTEYRFYLEFKCEGSRGRRWENFISGTTVGRLCCRAVLISIQHLLFFTMSEHLRWGNAGRWPLDNLHSALRPHTHLPLSLVMAAEWRDQPVPPVLSPGKEHVREWAATNQSFSSIFCLSALWAGLPVRSHVPQNVQDVASLLYS